MKSKIIVLMVVMLVGITQANLLPNAGFEDGDGSLPDGWAGYPYDFSGITWVDDAAGAHSGDRYIEMVSPNNTDRWLWPDNLIPVVGGNEYIASVWAKSLTPGEAAATLLNITWFDAGGANLGGSWIGGPDADNEWAEAVFPTLVAPAGAVSLDFNLIGTRLHGLVTDPRYPDSVDGIAYDDVSLTPEPMTLCLLGLGSLMIRRRRKA